MFAFQDPPLLPFRTSFGLLDPNPFVCPAEWQSILYSKNDVEVIFYTMLSEVSRLRLR